MFINKTYKEHFEKKKNDQIAIQHRKEKRNMNRQFREGKIHTVKKY